MTRTYSATNLALNDPTSLPWAAAYVRFTLRDKPLQFDDSLWPDGSLTNEEINALLTANAITDSIATGGDDTVYYVPHRVAADILRGNPMWLERYSVDGYSSEARAMASITRGILLAGAWINKSIQTSTSYRQGIGGSLSITF